MLVFKPNRLGSVPISAGEERTLLGAPAGIVRTTNGGESSARFAGFEAGRNAFLFLDSKGNPFEVERERLKSFSVSEEPVCPNCDQWQHPVGEGLDCLNDCRARGFA